MSAELPDWLRAALPERLRADARVKSGGVGHRELALQLGDHVIDVQLTEAPSRAFRTIGRLSFGYRVGEGVDPSDAGRLCEAVATALTRSVADQLVAYLESHASAAAVEPDNPRATMMLTEGELLRGRKLLELARATEVDSVELFLHGGECVQACRFCAYPSVRAQKHTLPAKLGAGVRALARRASGPDDALEWLARIVAVVRERAGARVVLSGPDCLRHPQIDAMLELLARETTLRVELLGPLTRLADLELARRVAAVPNLRSVCTSLLSSRAEIHDAMVGTPGAHAQVLQALANCRELGLHITINVLISPANVDDLPELLARCRELEVDNVNLSLYHPESANDVFVRASWRSLDLASVVVGPKPLLRAWAAIPVALLESVHAHYLPRCWVPAELRERLLRMPRDLQDNFCYLPACQRCGERASCPGLTVPAADLFGPDCVSPIG